MRVYVIRHGKVLHDWKKWCTSAEFDDLDRTLQTAEKIFGEEDFNRSALLNEVPLHSGFD